MKEGVREGYDVGEGGSGGGIRKEDRREGSCVFFF